MLVLGSVSVDGIQRPFSSARALDVITYLAFHRDGADAEQLRTWLWPADSPPTDQAFANVMSRARQGLGADAHGQPWLTRAGTDRVYRLLPLVRTDVDDFRLHVTRAEMAKSRAEAGRQLAAALRLVRGQPFTGGGSSSFLWADHHARTQVVFLVDETVHRRADLALADGDLDAARAALAVGLRLIQGCEQCFERRFRVAAADRNLTDLRAAMSDLQTILAADYPDLAADDASGLVSRRLHQLWEDLLAQTAG